MAPDIVDISVDFSKYKWATPDSRITEILPKEGLLREILLELIDSTDAPAIYHLAGVFTTAAAALSQCELHVGNLVKPVITPMAMWSVVIGDSGDRKSSALERSIRSFAQAFPERMFPTDASTEGWQQALSDEPISLLYRDELSGLFDATQRSYSNSLRSWLLETWSGNNLLRKTITHKECAIVRPRLSMLGGIPPSVFAEKTTRTDWNSGFLARFIYWGGRRQRWQPLPKGTESGKYTKWIDSVAKRSNGILYISENNVKPLTDWVLNDIEAKRSRHKPEIEATFQRLQATGYKLAAIVEMFKRNKSFGLNSKDRIVEVTRDSVLFIMPILEMLKSTITHIFNSSSIDKESADENCVLWSFDTFPIQSRKSVSENTGFGSKKTNSLIDALVESGKLVVKDRPTYGEPRVGRPGQLYMKNPIQ